MQRMMHDFQAQSVKFATSTTGTEEPRRSERSSKTSSIDLTDRSLSAIPKYFLELFLPCRPFVSVACTSVTNVVDFLRRAWRCTECWVLSGGFGGGAFRSAQRMKKIHLSMLFVSSWVRLYGYIHRCERKRSSYAFSTGA